MITKVNASELEGDALHLAVAKCEGLLLFKDAGLAGRFKRGWWLSGLYVDSNKWIKLKDYAPSSNWAIAGIIIERDGIDLINAGNIGHEKPWMAAAPKGFGNRGDFFFGDTPLIAAMRCYVASKLGDEFELEL